MSKESERIADFVDRRNSEKHLFTAGPASLLPENITGLRPCFGRGDEDYTSIEHRVIDVLKTMSGHSKIAGAELKMQMNHESPSCFIIYHICHIKNGLNSIF